MSKLTVKKQKIFSGSVSPNNVIAVFGSKKAGSEAYSDDPDTIQSLAAWEEGWSQAVETGNAPSIQDMNAFFYVATRQLAYLMQGGISEWNYATTYYMGSLVSDGLGTIYISVIDNNINNALTDETKWSTYISSSAVTPEAGSYAMSNSDYSVTKGLGVSLSIDLPDTTSKNIGRKYLIINLFSEAQASVIKYLHVTASRNFALSD